MQTLKIEFKNEIDLSILDNDFFFFILNKILTFNKNEVNNELSKN